jgi:hypothetical protein
MEGRAEIGDKHQEGFCHERMNASFHKAPDNIDEEGRWFDDDARRCGKVRQHLGPCILFHFQNNIQFPVDFHCFWQHNHPRIASPKGSSYRGGRNSHSLKRQVPRFPKQNPVGYFALGSEGLKRGTQNQPYSAGSIGDRFCRFFRAKRSLINDHYLTDEPSFFHSVGANEQL